MPYEIPVTGSGDRTFTANMGFDCFIFRMYNLGVRSLLDISDSDSHALARSIHLVSGVDNLLKGIPALDGYQLHVIEADPELGMTDGERCPRLIWFTPGEINPFTSGDPMDSVGCEPWV